MQPAKPQGYLKQRHLLFGSREFIIKDSEALLVRERSLFYRHETLIPLDILQANPTQSSSFAIKWLLLSLFLATITAGTIYLAELYTLKALYILALVLAGTTIVMLYRFFLYTTKLTIFRHNVSNENYLYLWRNRPNRRHFNRFIEELNELIKKKQKKTRG